MSSMGGSSANMSSQGGRGTYRGRGGRHGHGGGRGRCGQDKFNNNNTGRGSRHISDGHDNNNHTRPTCQVYKMFGHTTDRCWHRFDEDYVPEDRHATATTHAFNDNNWYTDSGATDLITGDLEKLAIRDKYTGNDQIHTASGSGMNIKHIGYSTIHTPSRQLMLNKILHVPQASKNLIYVHRLASDNNVFLEFHTCFLLYQGSRHEEHAI
jgi:hypothetical protein